jgi:cysteinyl-tRNA synthetase
MHRFLFPALLLSLTLALPVQAQVPAPAKAAQAVAPAALGPINPDRPPDFRAELRTILMELTLYAKGRNRAFQVLLRDGAVILEKDKWEFVLEEIMDPKLNEDKRVPLHGLMRPLARAIDGVVEDGLFCGDDTPAQLKTRLQTLAEVQRLGKRVLTIDTCAAKVANDALASAKKMGALPYVPTDVTALDTIPASRPPDENPKPIASLDDARNLLVVLDTRRLGPKPKALVALLETNQDVLILDVGQGVTSEALTKQEIYQLTFKKIGSPRKVLARMPITIAQAGALYWKPTWREGNPAWLFATDPTNPDRFYVDYRDAEWKQILGLYLAWVMDLGFDGVMFDDTGGWRHFETVFPLD